MLNQLSSALIILKNAVNDPSDWDSLVINRRKPFTYRTWIQVGNTRICLHRFETCDENEAFFHPHPWPGAFLIAKGSYESTIGFSKDRYSKPEEVFKAVFAEGSRYEITNPMTWHTVRPLSEVYTVMVNGRPWPREIAHTEVRTTKGKDLDTMSEQELKAHLKSFKKILKNYE